MSGVAAQVRTGSWFSVRTDAAFVRATKAEVSPDMTVLMNAWCDDSRILLIIAIRCSDAERTTRSVNMAACNVLQQSG